MPEAIGLTAGLSHYRGELERQRRLFRFMWWWFLLPLFLGIAKQAIAPGIRGGETLRAALGMAAALLLAVFVAMLNRDRARKFQAKLAMLAEFQER
jgi:formate hydrogenlyase subunit 4